MKKRCLFFLLLFSFLQLTRAQTTQLKFDHFAEKEGLPDAQILLIKQDDQGYIWISTVRGLVKYDGYKFKNCRLDKANPAIQISTMISDKDHNLWFSSVWSGIYKYSRKDNSFSHYPFPPFKKKGKNIHNFLLRFADDDGNLWGNGIVGFPGKNQAVKLNTKDSSFEYFSDVQKPQADFNLTCNIFQSGAAGHPIWAGTEHGLFLYDSKSRSFYPYFRLEDTAKQLTVIGIAEAPSERGILWLTIFNHQSKQSFIERLDTRDKSFKDFSHLKSVGLTAPNDTINDLYEDKKQRLWFATQNGLLLFNRQTQTFVSFISVDTDKEADKNQLYGITEARNGSLWLRCGKGLLNFDTKTHLFQRYTSNPKNPFALSWNNVTDLLIDQGGILWAGTRQEGVNKVNEIASAFQIYPGIIRDGGNYRDGVTKNITVSADGYCWYTNDRGIYKWRPGNNKPTLIYKIKKTDIGLDAICIAKDRNVYFTNGKGLQCYDPVHRQLRSYVYNKNDTASVSSNNINYIVQDHTGLMWIGTTDKGICTYNITNHKFKRYPYQTGDRTLSGDKLDDNCVDQIYEDRQGIIWVNTLQGGLNRFNRETGKFKSFLVDNHLRVGTNTNIFEDSKGRLWVANYYKGLLEFDRKTGHYIKTINEDSGLLFNSIADINEDKNGFLWVSSVRGLTRINPDDFTVKTYPINTILPGKNILSNYNLSSINNQMLMALTDGIVLFNPHDLSGNPYPPDVHIEKMSYSNPASVSDSIIARFTYGFKQLDLPWNQSKITFSYIALHYANPELNKYAYRLDGYDKHWVSSGTQRSATYTNLSPGVYTFYVKAANSDGVWNNRGDSIIVIIHSPWWQMWWAWMIYVVLFVTAVYAFVMYRSRKLAYDKRILEHKVHIRTEEVMHQKEEIETQRDSLEEQRNYLEKTLSELKVTQTQLIQSEKMASLGELTAGIAHEIQNPLNFVNNFSEVNLEMISELKEERQKNEKDEKLQNDLIEDILTNLQKISHHGKRADFIVKGMLLHSRTHSGERQLTDINILADEFLKLSFHGFRAKDKSFNADMVTHFDPNLPKMNVVQQDIGRVLLNLFNNAFYAVNQKSKTIGPGYIPTVEVGTEFLSSSSGSGTLIIKVKDNGVGIPDAIKAKIMQPFFTTKPTGEGTGLGLSLTYDMVVKGHGGNVKVESAEGEGSEFTIMLPAI
jgi:signal transduction histidine kinase/ligand-binding sensor domain-containing protein